MAVPSVAVVGFGVHTFFQYYGVGLDPQREQCLPGSRFIVYQRQYERPVRGQIYAFVAHNLTPYFEDGEKLFKVVDGVPGDTVEVSETGVSVNGVKVVSGLPLAKKLGSAGSAFVRTFVVPPRYYLMLGRTVDSYDGRYWGVVSESDLIGRVWQPIKDWKAHE
jgi:conjugal transfer pilin signal peptidase TrbI